MIGQVIGGAVSIACFMYIHVRNYTTKTVYKGSVMQENGKKKIGLKADTLRGKCKVSCYGIIVLMIR